MEEGDADYLSILKKIENASAEDFNSDDEEKNSGGSAKKETKKKKKESSSDSSDSDSSEEEEEEEEEKEESSSSSSSSSSSDSESSSEEEQEEEEEEEKSSSSSSSSEEEDEDEEEDEKDEEEDEKDEESASSSSSSEEEDEESTSSEKSSEEEEESTSSEKSSEEEDEEEDSSSSGKDSDSSSEDSSDDSSSSSSSSSSSEDSSDEESSEEEKKPKKMKKMKKTKKEDKEDKTDDMKKVQYVHALMNLYDEAEWPLGSKPAPDMLLFLRWLILMKVKANPVDFPAEAPRKEEKKVFPKNFSVESIEALVDKTVISALKNLLDSPLRDLLAACHRGLRLFMAKVKLTEQKESIITKQPVTGNAIMVSIVREVGERGETKEKNIFMETCTKEMSAKKFEDFIHGLISVINWRNYMATAIEAFASLNQVSEEKNSLLSFMITSAEGQNMVFCFWKNMELALYAIRNATW